MGLLPNMPKSWACISRVPTASGLVSVRMLTAKDLDQMRSHALSNESLGRHVIVRLCSLTPGTGTYAGTDSADAVFANLLTPAEIDILANVVAALNAIRVEPGEPNAVAVLGQAVANKLEKAKAALAASAASPPPIPTVPTMPRVPPGPKSGRCD